MTARLSWLPGVLRAAGIDVHEDPGWLGRETRPGFAPLGIVWHHTATSKAWQDGHVLALLRSGRRDLSGPLSQIGLERDGTWVLVAGGRANHNGHGTWGNDSIGIEAYNDGVGEPWPAAQRRSYEVGTAAICRHLGWDPATRVKGHKETDPGRKIDPAGLDMTAERRAVARLLAPRRDDDVNKEQDARLRNIEKLVQEAVIDTRAIEPRSREITLGVRVLLGRTGDVDEKDLAVSIADLLDDALAGAVADEIGKRLARR